MKDTKRDKEQFAAVMWGLAEEFGGKITANGLNLKFKALEEYDIEQITEAATWLLKHRGKTFPAVPTAKELIDAISRDNPVKDIKSQAVRQLDLVLEKLKFEGRNGACDFVDPVTKSLMTIRWPYKSWAQSITTKELVWFRKEFMEAYQAQGKYPGGIPQVGFSETTALLSNDLAKKMEIGD